MLTRTERNYLNSPVLNPPMSTTVVKNSNNNSSPNNRNSVVGGGSVIPSTDNNAKLAESGTPKRGRNNSETSPTNARSPRCEAFVMTGEKMLNLNQRISPCYAKVRESQLPPNVVAGNNGAGLVGTPPPRSSTSEPSESAATGARKSSSSNETPRRPRATSTASSRSIVESAEFPSSTRNHQNPSDSNKQNNDKNNPPPPGKVEETVEGKENNVASDCNSKTKLNNEKGEKVRENGEEEIGGGVVEEGGKRRDKAECPDGDKNNPNTAVQKTVVSSSNASSSTEKQRKKRQPPETLLMGGGADTDTTGEDTSTGTGEKGTLADDLSELESETFHSKPKLGGSNGKQHRSVSGVSAKNSSHSLALRGVHSVPKPHHQQKTHQQERDVLASQLTMGESSTGIYHRHNSTATNATAPADDRFSHKYSNNHHHFPYIHYDEALHAHLLNKQHFLGGSSVSDRRPSSVGESSDALLSVTVHSDALAHFARQLFYNQERSKLTSFLVKNDEQSRRLADEFMALFNFSGARLDVALRTFLGHVRLDGDVEMRAQLLALFAQRYYECNPTLFDTPDEVYALTSSLILLNKNLHRPNVATGDEKKMTCREFVDNLALTGFAYDRALLKMLYEAVRDGPFRQFLDTKNDTNKSSAANATTGEMRPGSSQDTITTAGGGGIQKGGTLGSAPLDPRQLSIRPYRAGSLALCQPWQQIDYKHGWLLRKSLYDSEGRRTPIGRRGWSMFYATIRGMVLYLHKDEHCLGGGPPSSNHHSTNSAYSTTSGINRFQMFNNCVLLHHSLAEIPRPDTELTRRKNVFLLRTATLGQFLFQTSEPNELQHWVDTINFVAAAFSTPALPTPAASSGAPTFYRPVLPSSPTNFTIPEQLAAHEQRLDEVRGQLEVLREHAPPLESKGRRVQEFFYRERFMEQERQRYTAYIAILKEKLAKVRRSSSTGSAARLLQLSTGLNSPIKTPTALLNPTNTNNSSALSMTAANGNVFSGASPVKAATVSRGGGDRISEDDERDETEE